MDLNIKYLKIGSSINIKRTDGRVHSAIIASINNDQRCVTVEWFEQGETKGKEMSMALIQSLNPNVNFSIPDKDVTQSPAFHKLQKDPFASSEEREPEDDYNYDNDVDDEINMEDNDQDNNGGDMNKLMVQSYGGSSQYSDDEFNSNQFSTNTTIAQNPTSRFQLNNGGLATSQSLANVATMSNGGGANLLMNNESTLAKESKIPVARTTISQSKDFVIPNAQLATSQSSGHVGGIGGGGGHYGASGIMNTDNTTIIKELTSRAGSSQVPNSRRTNVVKEVEKLKKNREERRQRQAEEKEAKEAFLKMDPGNPHWELLNMILEYRKGLEIKPLCENDLVEDHLITVCVRKRPLSRKEINKKEVDVITIPSKNQLIIHEPKNKVDLTRYLENQLFRFDYAFDETCSNEFVYRYTAQPLISTIFEGGFATCFAYGQTGSGKTHTMSGAFKPGSKEQDCQKGIYAMVAADIFRYINSSKYRNLGLVVSSSYFEIYSSKVFDLLNGKARLRILEDGKQQVQVVGLTEKVVTTTDDVLKLIQKGNQARTSGQTFANVNSSRSHAVFQIYLRTNNDMAKIHGKFSLIDLAGNERGADTSSADRQTRMEGAEINKSLLALKECIRALAKRGAHLPFRVSKLTQVLRDSFVGSNSKTCMIAMISPSVSSCEYTLNTLRYANRMKELGCGDLQTTTTTTTTTTAGGGVGVNVQNNGVINYNQPDLMEEQDLLELSSFSESEMPPEMLNFHKVISELQVLEETMIESHKQTVEATYAEYLEAVKLLQATESVEYDQEAYCKKWEIISNKMISMWTRSKEIVNEYKSKLAAEEQLSRATSKPR